MLTSSTPFINIPDYPDKAVLLARIKAIPGSVIVDSETLAKQAGSSRAQNTVMLGAASRFLLPGEAGLRESIRLLFEKRGDKILEANLKAFEAGRQAAA
jgi:indolepyruvate ferredoxin oxidoreductase beta subunit